MAREPGTAQAVLVLASRADGQAAGLSLAGGNGVSNSQGANAHGNAVSSGATPQPSGGGH
jgi:hypothetical protein